MRARRRPKRRQQQQQQHVRRGGIGRGALFGLALGGGSLLGLALALLLPALRLQGLAHPLVLQPLGLHGLQPLDLLLGGSLQGEELLLLLLDGGLVGGHLLLVRLEVGAGLVVGVHGVGRRLGGHVDEDTGLQLVARLLVAGQQRDAGRAGGDEAVHGHLLDLRLQGVNLLLQLSVLGGQLRGPVTQLLELGLGLEERGRGGVGLVPSGGDLPRRPLGGVVVGVGARGRAGHAETDRSDDQGQHAQCCRPAAGHGPRGYPGVAVR